MGTLVIMMLLFNPAMPLRPILVILAVAVILWAMAL